MIVTQRMSYHHQKRVALLAVFDYDFALPDIFLTHKLLKDALHK